MLVCPENLEWRTSSWTGGSNCVEVANNSAVVFVRDTKNRSQRMLAFPSASWEDFVRAVQTESITFS